MPDYVGRDQFNLYGPNPTGQVVVNLPPPPAPPPRRERRRRHTILVLMSNPLDTGPLRLGEEYRAIDMAITGARHRDRLDLRLCAATRYHDLQGEFARYRPTVVHFAGHSGVNGIALTDDLGGTHRVAPAALEQLFGIVGASIDCVVLNACRTEDQAKAIAKHVSCVVGMSRSVLDDVAIEFAAGFYRAIADGASLHDAFGLGRSRLTLAGVDARDPILVAAPGVAERLVIAGDPSANGRDG